MTFVKGVIAAREFLVKLVRPSSTGDATRL